MQLFATQLSNIERWTLFIVLERFVRSSLDSLRVNPLFLLANPISIVTYAVSRNSWTRTEERERARERETRTDPGRNCESRRVRCCIVRRDSTRIASARKSRYARSKRYTRSVVQRRINEPEDSIRNALLNERYDSRRGLEERTTFLSLCFLFNDGETFPSTR